MNISEWIDSMTAEQFEHECIKLLKHLKPGPYKISGTRYTKDGGRDIEGKVEGVPYEIWAECKKHTRSLGLDDISKNVILVISNGINELVYFSTSNITQSAQRNINIVAKKHNFSVSYYYGQRLYDLIKKLHLLHSTQIDLYSPGGLIIKNYLTAYKNTEKYSEISKLVLTRDNFFYIDFFLHNSSSLVINNISFKIDSSNFIKLNMDEIDNNFNMSPHTDVFVQIRGELLDSRSVQRVPGITVCFEIENKSHFTKLSCGIIDGTHLMYFPLIGKKANDFILSKISPILKANLNKAYIIEIKGGSGTGKSRLIKEICSIGTDNNYNVIQFDCTKEHDYTIIQHLICRLLYLPYNTGNITVSSKSILNILRQRNANEDFSDIIYSFVYKSIFNNETLYYIKQVLLNFLVCPVFEKRILLAFDNIQLLNNDVLDVIQFLIKGLHDAFSNSIIITSINTEVTLERNKEHLKYFENTIESYTDDYNIKYPCEEMSKNDAKSLYIHALNTDNPNLIDSLIQKSGKRPFDIIMLIKYLQEEQIIVWQGSSIWYIEDFDKLDHFLYSIPEPSLNLLKKRFEMQKRTDCSKYWESFLIVIKSLLYFGGDLPIQFVQHLKIEDDIMEMIYHSLFIKDDDYLPTIRFYHDNLNRFFYSQTAFKRDFSLARKISEWLIENDEVYIENKDQILFEIYIELSEIDKAKKHGLKSLRSNYQFGNFEKVSIIGRELLSIKKMKLSTQYQFEVMYMVANSEREKVNHENGCKMFYKAYLYLKEHYLSVSLTSIEYNSFMHSCINAHINASKPQKAIELLAEFEKSPTLDNYYQFIIQNRYSVAFLALGKTDDALASIMNALRMAEKLNDNQLISIAYSDLAYINFNNYENIKMVIWYFSQAAKFGRETSDLVRKAELYQQEALCKCLEGKIDLAKNVVNCSIDLCEQTGNTFLLIKALTLKAVVYAYENNYKEAFNLLDSVILKCNEIHSIVGKIKAYTNMSAVEILIKKDRHGLEYANIAIKLLKNSKLSVVKHKPLIYNYIVLCSKQKSYEELYNELESISNDKIFEFLDDIYSDSHQRQFGVLRKENAFFNF